VVLVHGAFVDGSGWAGVHRRLLDDGYPVIIVQNPTNSLAEDVAYTRRAIAAAAGPVVLVGHSYGGVVITETGNDPKVTALVYVAAFAPDEGESVSSLIGNPPPVIPPDAQRGMAARARATVRAVPGSHAVFIANPQVVVALVEEAARRL
jgi:alpha-beta hydrolase superfamily lysophospholipase